MISDYERRRLENIRRNNEEIEKIGLYAARDAARDASNGSSDANIAKEQSEEEEEEDRAAGDATQPARRSSRLRRKTVDYVSEKVIEPEPEPELKAEYRPKVSLRAKNEEMKALASELIKKNLDLLDLSKAKTEADDPYKEEARRLWGDLVEVSEDAKSFVASRMPAPEAGTLPRSPLELTQEDYAREPWKLLIACVLMSRVSSKAVKAKAITSFFDAYPTPSAALSMDVEKTFEILKPLGLFPNRIKAVADITRKFLTMENFEVSLQKEVKMYGVGQFTVDSYRIFCLGMWNAVKSDDRNLRAYCEYCKRVCGKE